LEHWCIIIIIIIISLLRTHVRRILDPLRQRHKMSDLLVTVACVSLCVTLLAR